MDLGGLTIIFEEEFVIGLQDTCNMACFDGYCPRLGVVLNFTFGKLAGWEEVAQWDAWWDSLLFGR